MQNGRLLVACTLIVICLMVYAVAPEDRRDLELNACIVEWNELLLQSAHAEDKFLTMKGVRAAAMMHVAIHDALNAIDRRYESYVFDGQVATADPLTAANAAAYAVAVEQYDDSSGAFERLRQKYSLQVKDREAQEAGIAIGQSSAAKVMEFRKDDGWNKEADYQWHPMAPGVYAEFHEHSGTPEGFVFGAGWAEAKPFLLSSADHFRSPPPPDIEGEDYAAALNEVKEVGSALSKTRTDDQSHLAMWWKDFVENSHNRLARQLVLKEQPDPWAAARMMALLNMGICDAYISSFNNKFHYNHWRPYTAIRWADNDGNPSTDVDPDWNNLHRHTYAFPSYPSAHGTASGAAFAAIAGLFGDQFQFTMTTEVVDKAGPFSEKIKMNPPTRQFQSFSQAAMECSMSRLYLGIHFRYDSVEGNRLGRKIGAFGQENFLQLEN